MNLAEKTKAIEVLTSSTDVTLAFNTPVSDNYTHIHEILIIRSNATVIKKLVELGYSLFMTDKGLSVEKF
jgi:hypothetical protein